MPTTATRTTCGGVKKNGAPCGSPAVDESGMCYWHSPRVSPEERHNAAMKGGLMCRPKTLPADTADVRLTSPEECLALLADTVSKVRRGELDIKIANSIAYNVTTATRVWEVAISAKLHKLEKMVTHVTGRRR
jgi:hypothetical protein